MKVGIVVIGASWGGLRALESLLGGLPAGFGAPIAVAQHRLEREEVLRPVVDEQDAGTLVGHAPASRAAAARDVRAVPISASGSTWSAPACSSAARGISGASASSGSCTIA